MSLATGLWLDAVPKYFFDSLVFITPADVHEMGCRGVAIDVDNTSAYDASMILFHCVRSWIKNMEASGIPIILLTNTPVIRAKQIARMFGNIPYIGSAGKPAREGYFLAAKKLGIKISELAMVGDQLFTDILGANDAGAVSIRVRPKKKEILFADRYKKIRREEREYLIYHGLEDMI